MSLMFRDGITNTLVQNFAVWIPMLKLYQQLKMLNKINICWCLHSVDSHLSKYFRITVISSQILVFAPSLVMRRWTLWISRDPQNREKKPAKQSVNLYGILRSTMTWTRVSFLVIPHAYQISRDQPGQCKIFICEKKTTKYHTIPIWILQYCSNVEMLSYCMKCGVKLIDK